MTAAALAPQNSPLPRWTLAEVAAYAGGVLSEPAEAERAFTVAEISTDSRALRAGEFFVALRGEQFDAHAFLSAAADGGALGALVDRPLARPGFPEIVTADSLAAWQRWAGEHRRRFERLRVLGLTGSSGKTTSKDLVTHLLEGDRAVHATAGNRNNHVGVPWTLLGLAAHHDLAVIEMGMNHPGEIALLSRLVRPDAALITDVGTAHVGHLGSREAILAAKLEILEGCAAEAPLVLPHDPWILDRLPPSMRGRKLLTYGLDPAAPWHPVGPVAWSLTGTRFATARTGPIRTSLLGPGAVLSSLAALAAIEALGLDPVALAPRLETAARRPLRMEPRRWAEVDWCLDCYNASPESTRLAISFLREVPHAGRRLLVLGELGELGEHAAAIHADLGRRTAAVPVVLFVGPGARAALAANRQAALPSATADWVENADEAAEWLRPRLRPRDLVLLKGSRRIGLERIPAALYPGDPGCEIGEAAMGATDAFGSLPRKED